jgi:hypothetical protein
MNYALATINHDFEEALNLSEQIIDNINPKNHLDSEIMKTDLSLNAGLDALAQIKINYYKNNKKAEYQDKYSRTEYNLLSKEMQLQETITRNLDKTNLLKQTYSGTSISIVALALLDGKNEEANTIIQKQIENYGYDRVLKMESGKDGNFWWYNNTDQDMNNKIIELIKANNPTKGMKP